MLENLLLTGFKGCGKSTLGRKLAWQLGMECYDLDTLIEEAWLEREGRSLAFREIFREVGADAFRELEAEAARAFADQLGQLGDVAVLALGGGALHNDRAREVLKPLGRVIFLDVPCEELIERVRRRGFPAYCDPGHPEEDFRRRFEERRPGYLEYSDLSVPLAGLDHKQAVDRIIESLKG